MVSKKIKTASEMLANIAAEGIFEKQGENVVEIDLRSMRNAVADFFIVCHGNSRAQVEAIADSVQMEIKKALGINVWKKEGFENAEWILLDYVDVVIHIFQESNRKFYKLEDLWADAGTKYLKPSNGTEVRPRLVNQDSFMETDAVDAKPKVTKKSPSAAPSEIKLKRTKKDSVIESIASEVVTPKSKKKEPSIEAKPTVAKLSLSSSPLEIKPKRATKDSINESIADEVVTPKRKKKEPSIEISIEEVKPKRTTKKIAAEETVETKPKLSKKSSSKDAVDEENKPKRTKKNTSTEV